MVKQGQILWEPSAEWLADANITAFSDWLEQTRDLNFRDYGELHRWSVEHLDEFWAALWDYFEVQSSTPYDAVLGNRDMPGAEWFAGSRLNYAEHIFRRSRDDAPAMVFAGEDKELAGKRKCKATLQASLKLDNGPRTPLITILGRFDSDSGFEILAEALTPMLERNLELVLMGPGQAEIIERMRTVEQTFAGRCRVIDGYYVEIAHTLLAGSDILLLPAHYHPSNALCAIAMRYGVVPVVYAHSGLEDTVADMCADKRKGTGFMFQRYSSDDLLEGIDEARAIYKSAPDWKRIVSRCLKKDFSWQESGRSYLKAYRRVTRRVRAKS